MQTTGWKERRKKRQKKKSHRKNSTGTWYLSNYSINELNFGLLNGKSGIIWSLLDLNNNTCDINSIINSLLNDIKEDLKNSDVDYSIDEGITGKALVTLKLYLVSKENKYLNLCTLVCEKIIDDFSNGTLQIEKIGLNKGFAGISLLFYYMYKCTNNSIYFEYGYDILTKDIKEYKEISGGWLYPDNRSNENTIYNPYLTSGTAGIAAIFIRYYKEYPQKFDKNILCKLMKGMQAEFSVDIGLFSGLTGLIHVHYDVYLYLNDVNMVGRVTSLLENLFSLLQETKDSALKTPGQLMFRYGCDYSHGGAGIIELINRINQNKKDYYLFLDSYL